MEAAAVFCRLRGKRCGPKGDGDAYIREVCLADI